MATDRLDKMDLKVNFYSKLWVLFKLSIENEIASFIFFKTRYLFEELHEKQSYFSKMSIRNFILQLKPTTISDTSRKIEDFYFKTITLRNKQNNVIATSENKLIFSKKKMCYFNYLVRKATII